MDKHKLFLNTLSNYTCIKNIKNNLFIHNIKSCTTLSLIVQICRCGAYIGFNLKIGPQKYQTTRVRDPN